MPTVEERLNSARLKIERAQKHIRDLDDGLAVFANTNPYLITGKKDLERQKVIYYVSRAEPIPPIFSLIVGDAIHNLMSALDHLAHQLFLVGTEDRKIGWHIYFPVFDCVKKYETGLRRKVEGMRPDAIQAIKALKPYKGGNDTLWKLHKLDNTDKHRLVLTVAAAFAGTKVGGLARYLKQLGEAVVPPFNDESFRLIFRSHMRICPLEKGEILITDATPGAEPNPDIEFDIEVAISEPEVVECEPLLPTLQQMTDLVEKIVAIFAPLLEP